MIEDGVKITELTETTSTTDYDILPIINNGENKKIRIPTMIKYFNKYKTTYEFVCGEWIDGKPIYRKVISLGTLPNANTLTISSGITETIFPIKVYGVAINFSETFPLPFIWGDTSNPNNYCGIFYNRSTNEIWFRTNRDMSSYEGYGIVEYTKND